jgi:hypothetical protein
MTVKERPILFSGPMVRAIMAGNKTQTRRVMKLPPHVEKYGPRDDVRRFYSNGSGQYPGGNPNFTGDQPPGAKVSCKETCQTVPSPYGHIGDHLWVRESHAFICCEEGEPGAFYGGDHNISSDYGNGWFKTVYVADVNVIEWDPPRIRPSIHLPRWAARLLMEVTSVKVERLNAISAADCINEGIPPTMRNDAPAKERFAELWDGINADRAPWESNPWVWVVEFKPQFGQSGTIDDGQQ